MRSSARTLRSSALASLMALALVSSGGEAVSATAQLGVRALHSSHTSPHAWGRYVSGEVLVKFRRGRAPSNASSAGGESFQDFGGAGWKVLTLKRGESVDEALSRLRRDPRVSDVTQNHVYNQLSLIPNDTFFNLQWGLRNTGQIFYPNVPAGTPGADVSATSAWDVTTGSYTVRVGVVDTGVAIDNPDLAPNIDFLDAHSWVNTSSNGHPTYYDQVGHGTHVAGIIGATGNDGYGVSGISPHVAIVPLRVLDQNGQGSTVAIASAFHYAAQHGIKVVNASLGGTEYDAALGSEIVADSGTLFVVAAGNGGGDDIGSGWSNDAPGQAIYPCDFTAANLICVAASDANDVLAGFSNYGSSSVDLASPGDKIVSTAIPTGAGAGGAGDYALADSPNGGYGDSDDSWAEMVQPLDLNSSTGCSINYLVFGFLWDSNDVLTVQTSPDDSTWTDVAGSSFSMPDQESYLSKSVPLGADGQSIHVRFHIGSDAAGTDDGIYIDNVSVTCNGNTTPFATDTFAAGDTSRWTFGGAQKWGTTKVVGNWTYMSGTSMATPSVSGTAALILAHQPSASVARVKDLILASVDAKAAFTGKTVTGGRLNALRALQYSNDIAAPTGLAFTGAVTKPFQLASSMTVEWTATDAGAGSSGLKNFDVRYERAPFNGGWGTWVTWKSGTTAKSATFSSSPGYSYCFEVRARDHALNTSGWRVACTSFPVNDTQMTASAGWARSKSTPRYRGTDSYTTTKGATLTLPKVYFRTMDLVVSLCNGCGSVAVYFGSGLYGTYSLNASSLQTRHLILVRAWSRVVGPATVTIKVTTSGKPVAIEGLGILRY